jgi:hypothetical protein
MRFFYLIIVVLIGAFTSCLYSPTETNWNDIDANEEYEVVLFLEDFQDTIPIVDGTSIFYEFDIGENIVYEVQFAIGGVLKQVSHEKSGYINIDNHELQNGFHNISINIYTNTGTGSLADKVGMEVLLFSFEYVLDVNLGPPDEIEIISFENADGLLQLFWEKYQNRNFQSYEIYKKLGNRETKIYSTNKIYNVVCFDSLYVGGLAEYYVITKSLNGKSTKGPIAKVDIPGSRVVSVELFDSISSSYQISWSKCAFYKAFKSYSISSTHCKAVVYDDIYDINSTKLIMENLGLEGNIYFSIVTSSIEHQYSNSSDYISNQKISLSEDAARFGDMCFHEQSNVVVQMDGDSIYEQGLALNSYKNNQLIARRELYLNTGLTASGEFVTVATPTSILYLDPVTLETKEKYDLSAFGILCNYVHKMQATDDRAHLIGISNKTYETQEYYLLDLMNSRIIYKTDNPDTIFQIDISRNGQFLIVNNSLYKVESNSIVFHLELDPNLWDWRKEFSYSGNLIIFNSNMIKYLSSIDLSPIYEYHFENPISTYGRFVDKNRFLYYSDCYLTVIDLELKRIIYRGQVNSTYEFTEFFLTDRFIYSNDGFRFKYSE